jgi:hypothetical protein
MTTKRLLAADTVQPASTNDELIRTLDEMSSPAGYFEDQWDKEKKDLYELLRSFSPNTKPN